MSVRDRIVSIINEAGVGLSEKERTIRTECPVCHREDKFSILKKNGACICYRGSCSFGKKWFVDWIAITFSISVEDAKAKYKGTGAEDEEILELSADLKIGWTPRDPDEDPLDAIVRDIVPIDFPEFHMATLDRPDAAEGVRYLASRGVDLAMAQRYGVCYSKYYRRVYFPVTMEGVTYGYQGRHIDQVLDHQRMRNNTGFRRECMVMFADQMIGKDFAIIAEGPFDAIKFDQVGGNVCTMGKVVTSKQLDIIRAYDVSTLYLALDDDAVAEMNEIVSRVKSGLDVYRINVPESCRERCQSAGKKADFGECTMDEASQAFRSATRLGMHRLAWRT